MKVKTITQEWRKRLVSSFGFLMSIPWIKKNNNIMTAKSAMVDIFRMPRR
jgi:hypothetical protein